MTETREHLRMRLAEIYEAAHLESIESRVRNADIESVEQRIEISYQVEQDAAEAVYAQAIRDLLDHIGGMTIHDDVGGSESTDKMLRDFAAERGINFGEE